MAGLIAGNWKMNGSMASARSLAEGIVQRVAQAKSPLPDVALCPPAPLLSVVGAAVGKGPVALGAQDCHPQEKGAHTGDISPVLLAECGCKYVIVGHSERRTDHGESDDLVRRKASAALKAGLIPIICVGETEKARDQGVTGQVIARQVAGSVPSEARAETVVIAYEPVWAIGTGRTPTIPEIEDVHRQIREHFGSNHGNDAQLRILYVGSVKGSNAAEVLAAAGVNGALVGGASLDLEDFWRIVTACPA
jgi:triosephosphate isomerase